MLPQSGSIADKENTMPFNEFRSLSDKAWLDLMVRSIDEPEIGGVRFASFPDPTIQKQIIGSSGAGALKEAWRFYVKVKDAARLNGVDPQDARILDFGAGWGRMLRFFAREAGSDRLFGVDTDVKLVDLCRTTGVPGSVTRTAPNSPLPFRDGLFDVIYAYSVFTHLPEHVHVSAMQELARCLRPGGILVATLQPRRFLDYCRSADPTSHQWHAILRAGIERMPDAEARFDRGEFVTLALMNPDYGDVLVPPPYINRNWASHFKVCEYLDDPKAFQQAVLTVQRL
jgi:SAM-dependent methyltransferase